MNRRTRRLVIFCGLIWSGFWLYRAWMAYQRMFVCQWIYDPWTPCKYPDPDMPLLLAAIPLALLVIYGVRLVIKKVRSGRRGLCSVPQGRE